MKIEPIVAMEIGTSHVRVFVGEAREDDALMITAVGEAASSGMRKGEIFNFESIVTCAETALRQAEDAADVKIEEVYLAVSGSQIEAMPNRAEISVNAIVTQEDMDRVTQMAKDVTLANDREIIHCIFGQYSVDGLPGVSPLGMVANRLTADMLIVHGVHARLLNSTRVVKALKIEKINPLFSGLCSARAALSAEQKNQGALLIDLGGGKTDYVVYAQGKIADAGVLGVGGDHVTNDLARVFRLSTTAAETLKLQHGDAMVSATARTRRIPLPAAVGESPRTAKLSDLQTVVHLRMEETFGLIDKRMRQQKWLSSLGAGVVLTGGGARLKQVALLAEKIFGLPCEIGFPRNVGGLTANLAVPEYATGIGAVLHGYRSALAIAKNTRSPWNKVAHWFGVR